MMSTYETLLARLLRRRPWKTSKAAVDRRRNHRSPGCEAMEGRQLLNAAWGHAWHANQAAATGAAATTTPPAHVFAPHSGGPRRGHAMPALTAQAKADMATLQADEKAFQAEIPADLTATLKADHAIIDQALAKLGPQKFKAGAKPLALPSSSDPTAMLTRLLTDAGVPADQITKVTTDFANAKTTLANLDPTLQAKIQADHAAVEKDLGLPAHPAPADGAPLLGPDLGLGLGGPGDFGGPGGHGGRGGHDRGFDHSKP